MQRNNSHASLFDMQTPTSAIFPTNSATKQGFFTQDVDDANSFAAHRSAMEKQTEAYGFVIWVSSFFGMLAYVLWSVLPEHVLQHVGVYYYPDKMWALQLPAYLCAVWLVYCGAVMLCFHKRVPPLDSVNTIQDTLVWQNQTQIPLCLRTQEDEEENLEEEQHCKPLIPPLYDIPVHMVSAELFHKRVPVVPNEAAPATANRKKKSSAAVHRRSVSVMF